MVVLGRHQALVWDKMGVQWAAETETFLSESCWCSYLHCVLLLALGGDTDGPRRSFKRRVQGGGLQLGIQDEGADKEDCWPSYWTLDTSEAFFVWSHCPPPGDLGDSQLNLFLFEEIVERKQGGCCFNWGVIGCGEIRGGILGSTWRAVASSWWLGRETHKWGGREGLACDIIGSSVACDSTQ